MSDEQYRQMVRSGLAPLVEDVPEGPEWDDLIADDIVMAAPAPPRRAPGWLIGLAMATVVLVLGGLAVVLSPSAPPSTTGPVATAPPTTTGEDSPTTSFSSGSPGLFPVTLGVDHLWPETPSQLSPVELAELFVEETLGWESAGGTEFSDGVPDGPTWVRVKQPGVEELVDVLTVPSSDGGRAIVEVGTPWEKGVAISPMEPEGTRVSLLRIVGSVQGDVTIRLSDGRQVVASTPIDLSSTDSIWVTFPDVNPVLVRSVLVRYVDEDGKVIAATGGSQPDLTSTASTSEVPESCPVTVAGTDAFTPASETPKNPPSVYEVVWYGTPQLWTMINPEGEVWTDLPVGADGSLTQKTFWWSENYSPRDPGEMTVTAQHLDGTAPTIEASQPAGSGFHPFMLQPTHESVTVVGLGLPDTGCWELNAEYKGASLSYVVWVGND